MFHIEDPNLFLLNNNMLLWLYCRLQYCGIDFDGSLNQQLNNTGKFVGLKNITIFTLDLLLDLSELFMKDVNLMT